ncbi:unnamed protein product [Mytilus edulis]|uniref:Uncharacterized protein n=1 Tax=Mytilus edulis TaxID=6550 RepID=A0A8S3QPH4_MYTED|nr:unnamed protein product [Mytilus edulis]
MTPIQPLTESSWDFSFLMQKERLVCGYECIVRRICDVRRKENGVQKEKEKWRKTPCSSHPDSYTVSLALYRYLCQNIVGTENYVKSIRQLNAVRDDVMSTKSTAHIISGSFGEGLEMRGSDLDVMDIGKLIEVYADENTQPNPNKLYFRMETDDVKPDMDTNTVSLALYRYLCQNIIGTENHVKTMRLMNTVMDNLKSSMLSTTITSGSFGEGLEMRGSDLDNMNVAKLSEVYEYKKTRLCPYTIYYKMETDDVKPGFTQLLLERKNNKATLEYCEELNGNLYLSSAVYKQPYLDYGETTLTLHGPCLSDNSGILDIAFSFHYICGFTSEQEQVC